MAETARTRAPRRDGVRNRAVLVAVASEAFRHEGLDVGVDEIARRAGVGVATLYRHFPAKTDLVAVVAANLIEQLRAHCDAALDAGDPATALRRFLASSFVVVGENRGFTEALAQHPPDPAIREHLRREAVLLLEPLAARAREHGELDDAYGAEDLLVVLRMLSVTADPTLTDTPLRYLDVLLAGLRPPR
jgi:AcrR family transcriptional regulator